MLPCVDRKIHARRSLVPPHAVMILFITAVFVTHICLHFPLSYQASVLPSQAWQIQNALQHDVGMSDPAE